MQKPTLEELRKLSVEDRLQLVEDIWTSLDKERGLLPMPGWHGEGQERRLMSFEDNPDAGSSWPEVKERLDRLSDAKKMAVSDPGILSGTPVIEGTRVPVYDVAASVEKGTAISDILDSYPGLSPEQVELAALYAKAVPPQGRPKRRPLPEGAKILADRDVPRRGRA